MTVQLITNAQLDELEAQHAKMLASLPEIEKAIKANLLTPQQLEDARAAIKRIEGILQIYRPAALSPARGRPSR